jgi:hypothetical protein
MVNEQLKQATDRNTATQSAIAQSGRGNAALANIVAANNSNNFGQAASQQASIARIAEANAANQLYGQTLGSARAQDSQENQFNAQQANYTNQANLEAKLRTMGLNDAAILGVMNQVNTVNQQPTVGDQILAGGVGALGQYAGQRGMSRANAANAGNVPRPYVMPINDQGPGGVSAFVAPGSDEWLRMGGYGG